MRLIDRLGRLPLLIVLGWMVAAFLAVLVGVVGIGLVGSGLLTPRPGDPVSEDEVRRALAETPSLPAPSLPAPSGSAPSGSAPSGSAPAVSVTARSFPTAGGIVVAVCGRILSMSPAQGYEVHEQQTVEGEFRALRGRDRVKVELTGCDRGLPRLRVRTDD